MKKEEKKLIEFLQNELGKTVELKGDLLTCYAEEVNVDELSKVLRVPSSLIISFFWKTGRNITKNQALTFDLVNEFCATRRVRTNFVKQVEINEIMSKYLNQYAKEGKRKARTPVVSVMGHIDHGKSTLLDTIRNSQDQKKEEGGITQRINIYPVQFNNQKITFLDTPGHDVFLKMRERGATSTDLVVLVIDSNDGVMPQTVEVIEHIHKYQLPTIAFINNKKKEPLSTANLERIKSQLQDRGLVAADWGGELTVLSGSAISKADADELLENILFLAEVHDWKANYETAANGIIVDHYVNNKRGIVNVALVKNGTLVNRDNMFVNGVAGKVRNLVSFLSKDAEVTTAKPGEVVEVYGLGFEAEPGDNFLVLNDETLLKKIKRIMPTRTNETKKFSQVTESEELTRENSSRKNINLVLLADSQNSLEALVKVAKSSSTVDALFNPIYAEAGELNDSIVSLAKITQSSIIMFNLKTSQQKARDLKTNKVQWFESNIIYKIGDGLVAIAKSFREKKKTEKIIGVAEIKKIFYFSQVGSIAGCQVLSGTVNRNHLVNVFRKEVKIFSGKISSLQKDKNNVKEISKGQECGIVVNGFNEFQLNDQIIAYSLTDEENKA